MRIVWSPLAIERAAAEAAFISADKPEAARNWLNGLFAAVDRLAAFPLSGKAVPEISLAGYRQLTYKSHRVVYQVRGDIVAIVTVRRFKQQLPPSDYIPFVVRDRARRSSVRITTSIRLPSRRIRNL